MYVLLLFAFSYLSIKHPYNGSEELFMFQERSLKLVVKQCFVKACSTHLTSRSPRVKGLKAKEKKKADKYVF